MNTKDEALDLFYQVNKEELKQNTEDKAIELAHKISRDGLSVIMRDRAVLDSFPDRELTIEENIRDFIIEYLIKRAEDDKK